MTKKLRVGVICGGVSCEHEVSLASAQNVIQALDPAKYEPVTIYIDKKGHWHQIAPQALLEQNAYKLLTGGSHFAVKANSAQAVALPESALDVVFPVLHGPYGEDGTVQGFFRLAKLAFVGADVCGSAIGMDKDLQKRLLRDAGLPVVNFRTLYARKRDAIDLEGIVKELGLPLFVKPANLGSSVGISKAKTLQELAKAIDTAFQFDTKILIEEAVSGRELECGVLGNDHLTASLVGEVITSYEFYDFEAKYLDEKLVLDVPASITAAQAKELQQLAMSAFECLSCAGMARVDFFLRDDGKIFINEINTIPGFTSQSMYPRLWQASGLCYADLIDKLIELALERHTQQNALRTSTLINKGLP